MTKKRADFTQDTKNIISARAAYRCCFPDCDVTLIGPGYESNSIDNIGECAHIYAASGTGPRSYHNLNETDLQKPENGLFLCRKHHALIDKGKGRKYSAVTLMLYKQLHEHKISKELGHISYPLMWLKNLTILDSPILKKGVVYDFTKSTIISGENSVGKTVLIEHIYTALTGDCLKRFEKMHIELCIEMSNPLLKKILCIIDSGIVKYIIDKQELSFCPFELEIIYLREPNKRIKGDWINWISAQLGKERRFVKALIASTDLTEGYKIKKVCMETIRKKPYETINVKIQKKDDKNKDNFWSIEQCSASEIYGILFDLVVGYMRNLSRYKNTLFLVDWSYINTFDDTMKNHYFRVFYNSNSFFQTIATMHTLWKDVDWSGWNLLKMTREDNLAKK